MIHRPASPAPRDTPEVLARVKSAMTLVGNIATQTRKLLPSNVLEADLVSYGNEGALHAARTFDPTLNVPFARWASIKVRGKMIDGLRAQATLPRSLHRKLRALAAALVIEEGTLEEDAAQPPDSPESADARLSSRLAAMATSMAASALFISDEATLDAIEDGRGSAEDLAIREELRARVRSAIAERPEKERRLLEGVYYDGLTLEEASGGLSRSWSSRLLAKATVGVAKALQRSDG
jgi:RNA polymerase sigma factor for flagellar operon FliA